TLFPYTTLFRSGLFGGSSIDWRCAIDSKDIFQKCSVRQQAMLTSRRADKLQRDRKTIGGETARQRQDRKRRKRQTVTNGVPFVVVVQGLAIDILKILHFDIKWQHGRRRCDQEVIRLEKSSDPLAELAALDLCLGEFLHTHGFSTRVIVNKFRFDALAMVFNDGAEVSHKLVGSQNFVDRSRIA